MSTMSAAQQLRQKVRGRSSAGSNDTSYAEYARVGNDHLQLTASDGHPFALAVLRGRHTIACAALSVQMRRDRDLYGHYDMSAGRHGDMTRVTLTNHLDGRTMTVDVSPYTGENPLAGAKSRHEYARDLTGAMVRLREAAEALKWPAPPPRTWAAGGLTFTEDGPESHREVASVAFVSSRPFTRDDVNKLVAFTEYRAAYGRRKLDDGEWDPDTGMKVGTVTRRGMHVLTVDVDWNGVTPRHTSRATIESHRKDLLRMIRSGVHPKRNPDGTFVRRPETRGKVDIDPLEPGSDVRVYYGQG